MTTIYNGQLEIDHERGVVYFHQTSKEDQQPTLLRVCRLGEIPSNVQHIDVTHKIGVSFETRS